MGSGRAGYEERSIVFLSMWFDASLTNKALTSGEVILHYTCSPGNSVGLSHSDFSETAEGITEHKI